MHKNVTFFHVITRLNYELDQNPLINFFENFKYEIYKNTKKLK